MEVDDWSGDGKCGELIGCNRRCGVEKHHIFVSPGPGPLLQLYHFGLRLGLAILNPTSTFAFSPGQIFYAILESTITSSKVNNYIPSYKLT
jgi:hypothetical protein